MMKSNNNNNNQNQQISAKAKRRRARKNAIEEIADDFVPGTYDKLFVNLKLKKKGEKNDTN